MSNVAEWVSAAGSILASLVALYMQRKAENASKSKLKISLDVDIEVDNEIIRREVFVLTIVSASHCPCFIAEIGVFVPKNKSYIKLEVFERPERISEHGESYKWCGDLDSVAELIATKVDGPTKILLYAKTTLSTFYSSGKSVCEVNLAKNIANRFD